MTVEEWSDQYLDRFDELRLYVRVGRPGVDPPEEVERRWLLTVPEFQGDRDEPALALLNAVRAHDGTMLPHNLRDTRNYYSWGASGAGQDLLLHVSNLALDVSLTLALQGLLRRVRARQDQEQDKPVDRSEAEQRAQWHVTTAYELDVQADLELVGEELTVDPPVWTIQLRDSDSAYEVELEACGIATFTRTARRSRSDTQGTD